MCRRANVGGPRKPPRRLARNTPSTARHTRQLTGTLVSECSCVRSTINGIPHSAHGADELGRERIVHLGAQVADIDIDDVGEALEALVPYVLDDHRAGVN